jgi:hypothetical protein
LILLKVIHIRSLNFSGWIQMSSPILIRMPLRIER